MIKDVALLACSAVLYTLACSPYDWSVASWVALTPLFLSLYQPQTWRAAACRGLLFGVFSCTGVGYWIYVTTAQYFSLSAPAAVLLTSLNYAYFAGLYTALAAVVVSQLLQQPATILRAISIPAAWVGSELARTHGVAGIPWELFGYTQYRFLSLIQIADLTGVYGISFLLALSSYVVAEVFRSSYQLLQSKRQKAKSKNDFFDAGRRTPDTGLFSLIPDSRPLAPIGFPWPAVMVLTVTLLVTLFYGTFRLSQYDTAGATSEQAVTIAVE